MTTIYQCGSYHTIKYDMKKSTVFLGQPLKLSNHKTALYSGSHHHIVIQSDFKTSRPKTKRWKKQRRYESEYPFKCRNQHASFIKYTAAALHYQQFLQIQ